MSARIQIRRDTAAHWTTNNPVLAEGEMGFETDTRKTKVGDGVTAWVDLLYATGTSLPNGMIGDQYGGSPEITNPDPTVSSAHYYQVKTNGTTDNVYGRAVIGWHDAVSNGTYNRIVIDNQGTVIKAVDWSNGWGNGSYAYDWSFGPTNPNQAGIGLPFQGLITESNLTINGASTNVLDLIPGTTYNNNQFLRLQATAGGDAGNHIHLLSGDLSVTDIFLGDDNTFVKVNTSTVVIGTAGGQNNTSTGYAWVFGVDGTLYKDGDLTLKTNEEGSVRFKGYIDNGSGDSGATLHVTEIIRGTITDGMTIYSPTLNTGWTLAFGTVIAPQGSGGIGNYFLSGADYLTGIETFHNNDVSAVTWVLDADGKLTYPNGTMIKGSTKRIPGTGNVYASSSGTHLIWTASTSTLVAAKVEVRVQFEENHRTELFTVQFVKDDTNFNSTVTNYITSDPTYGDPTITPGIDGSGHFTITYTDPHGNGNGFIFDAVEYDTTW